MNKPAGARFLLSAVGVLTVPVTSHGATGTFLDRTSASDLRIGVWNVNEDSVFSSRNAKFNRIADAVDADIWCFQEMYSGNPASTKNLMDTVRPLGTPAGWHVYQSGEHAIASKYALSMGVNNTQPAGYRPIAMALADLPDSRFATDLYLMDVHYRCCGGTLNDPSRQKQSDALINWMRDARTPGGAIDLPAKTAMAVLGDYNLVGGPQPLTTLLDGNIIDQALYGPDSAPDWDGTHNADAVPRHNLTGTDTWTWRNDLDVFDPGRLDFITWTDSVLPASKRFVLNSVAMTAADRSAAGLQQYDTCLDNVGQNYDHLPLVIDFAPTVSQWAVDASGDWFAGSNWTVGVPNAAGVKASLLDIPQQPRTVMLSADVTLGQLFLDNVSGYRLQSSGGATALKLNAPSGTARVDVLAGSHTIDVLEPVSVNLVVNVAAPESVLTISDLRASSASLIKPGEGILEVNRVRADALEVGAGTVRILSSTEADARASGVMRLMIADGARLDLSDRRLVVAEGDLAAITGLISSGRNGGQWDGDGIITSMSDAHAGDDLTTIGVARAGNTVYAGSSFGGITVSGDDVLLMYTWGGDANLDGVVNIDDYGRIDGNVAVPGASGWFNGDFNYDGKINIDDYGIIDGNIGRQGQPLSTAAVVQEERTTAVPEPGLAGIAAVALLMQRKRRRQKLLVPLRSERPEQCGWPRP